MDTKYGRQNTVTPPYWSGGGTLETAQGPKIRYIGRINDIKESTTRNTGLEHRNYVEGTQDTGLEHEEMKTEHRKRD